MTAADTTPQVGRPREFDHDAVLDAVVELFWEKGFGATSVGDIVARTGLSKSSLYGAFGSKDALFETALDRYVDDHQQMVAERLLNGNRGLDDIEAFFAQVVEEASREHSQGCFAVNTATELRNAEPIVVQLGVRHRDILRGGFTGALNRAVELDEVDADRVPDLANMLVTTALGLAVMVGGGATADEVNTHVAATRNSLRRP
ncbi:MAG: TetR/AcrR family transcriptional regulator [Actinomycetota bacterium]